MRDPGSSQRWMFSALLLFPVVAAAAPGGGDQTWLTWAPYLVLASTLLLGFGWLRLTGLRRHSRQLEGRLGEREKRLAESEEETRRKADELRDAAQQLEDSERRARSAQREAEQAAALKGRFLATMSHELRTPMNAVIGMTSLLLESNPSEEQREYLETIRLGGESLLAIINDILDLSKVESGRFELESRAFDLRGCVEDAIELVAGPATRKGLDLGCIVDPGTPQTIRGDETRLRQILVNLLSNAIKFTPSGHVVARVASEGPGQLHFHISDTGIGIPKDRLHTIFEAFAQADSSTTRSFGGTGLGLTISKRLVEAMNGRIWVESESGEGAEFHFTVEAPEAAGTPSSVVAPLAARVLVASQSAVRRATLLSQLRAIGVEAEAATGAHEATALLAASDRFQLALMDTRVLEAEGFVSGTALLGEESRVQLVLCMAEPAESGLVEPSLRVLATLPQTVRSARLREALARVLRGESGEPTAPPPPKPVERPPQPLAILVADDDPVNQRVAVRMLARLGYQADVRSDGRMALDAMHRRAYDIAFIDLRMPEVDGLGVVREALATWPPGQRPRLVALTADALSSDRDACLQAGFDDFVAKPVRLEELRAAIDKSSVSVPRAVAAEVSEGVIDWSRIDQLRRIGPGPKDDIVRETVEFFLQYVPARLVALEDAVKAGDAEGFALAVHGLKGSSAQFGAVRMASLCRDLEEPGRRGELAGARASLKALAEEFERVHKQLSERVLGRIETPLVTPATTLGSPLESSLEPPAK